MWRAEDSGIVKAAALQMPSFARPAVAPGSVKNPSVEAQILIHNARLLGSRVFEGLALGIGGKNQMRATFTRSGAANIGGF
jgi:hypothetical protein